MIDTKTYNQKSRNSRLRHCRQSLLKGAFAIGYALVLSAVLIGLVGGFVLFRQSVSGRIRETIDSFGSGRQYEPRGMHKTTITRKTVDEDCVNDCTKDCWRDAFDDCISSNFVGNLICWSYYELGYWNLDAEEHPLRDFYQVCLSDCIDSDCWTVEVIE